MAYIHHDHHHHSHDIHPHIHECDDQLPVFAATGRGLQGNSYKVEINTDGESETTLKGIYIDARTGEATTDWISENINGGKLSYYYNLYPADEPPSFTMTFVYRRPGRTEWSWTTPKIPYNYDYSDYGTDTIGSGVATVFVRKTTDSEWTEKLIYPPDTTREDFNAPDAEEPWTVNLTFGIGGDIDIPNIEELEKLLGLEEGAIYNYFNGDTFTLTLDGDTYKDYKEYIDKQDDIHKEQAIEETLDHVHQDLGFPDDSLAGDGGSITDSKPWHTVKEYIDWIHTTINNIINGLKNDIAVLKQSSIVYSGSIVQPWFADACPLFAFLSRLPTGETLHDWFNNHLASNQHNDGIGMVPLFFFDCQLGDDNQMMTEASGRIAIDSHWSEKDVNIEMRLQNLETGQIYNPGENGFTSHFWNDLSDPTTKSIYDNHRSYYNAIAAVYPNLEYYVPMVRINWIVALPR